jgi:alginate O-acetyltransferase complex protein AlgJ
MLAKGGGLFDHLCKELAFTVDLVGVRGSGATPVRIRLLRAQEHLNGKKLVIWCFTAREFTQSQKGWMKVPLSMR